jgi:hypothetical protein
VAPAIQVKFFPLILLRIALISSVPKLETP